MDTLPGQVFNISCSKETATILFHPLFSYFARPILPSLLLSPSLSPSRYLARYLFPSVFLSSMPFVVCRLSPVFRDPAVRKMQSHLADANKWHVVTC